MLIVILMVEVSKLDYVFYISWYVFYLSLHFLAFGFNVTLEIRQHKIDIRK